MAGLGKLEIVLLLLVATIAVSTLAGLIKRRQDRLIDDVRQQLQVERDRRSAVAKQKRKQAAGQKRRQPESGSPNQASENASS